MIGGRANQRDLGRIGRLIDDTTKTLNKDADKMVKQTTAFALISAAKATEPGPSSKLSKMAKKLRVRPLVPLTGNWYAGKSGKPFRTAQPLTRQEVKSRKLKKVTKGIKKWDKKATRFVIIPYVGTKRDENNPLFKIPAYGAGKAGWLQAYRILARKSVDVKGIRSVLHRTKLAHAFASIENKVGYAAKTSPNAARIGISKATKRMEKIYWPKIKRKMTTKWNRSR